MVCTADRIFEAEALAAQKKLASLLSYKLKREYSEMFGFVRAMTSLEIVRSNTFSSSALTIKGRAFGRYMSLRMGR